MSHPDPIFDSFIAKQPGLLERFRELNPDLVSYRQVAENAWLVELRCPGLVKKPGEEVEEANRFQVGITMPPDYCRRVDPRVVALLTPHVWHPNVLGPGICLGRVRPAMPITDLLTQVVEIITYLNFATHDALNPDASEWVRHNLERFPLEDRGIRLPSLAD